MQNMTSVTRFAVDLFHCRKVYYTPSQQSSTCPLLRKNVWFVGTQHFAPCSRGNSIVDASIHFQLQSPKPSATLRLFQIVVFSAFHLFFLFFWRINCETISLLFHPFAPVLSMLIVSALPGKDCSIFHSWLLDSLILMTNGSACHSNFITRNTLSHSVTISKTAWSCSHFSIGFATMHHNSVAFCR